MCCLGGMHGAPVDGFSMAPRSAMRGLRVNQCGLMPRLDVRPKPG